MFARCVWRRWTWCAAAAAALFSSFAQAEPPKSDGRELFEREWIARDPRSHSGDGLGPLFNDTSCIACHNQGGAGGGGAKSKNAQIVSVISSNNIPRAGVSVQQVVQDEREALKKIHAGFANGRGIVLHRSSTEESFAVVRRQLLGFRSIGRQKGESLEASVLDEVDAARRRGRAEVNGFGFTLTERNTTALFGSGAIDAIPDDVLIAAAEAKYEEFPDVSGRVSKLQGGQLGRFGWKGQTAALNEFVRTACAVELGLEVPGISQADHRPASESPDDLFEKAFPEKVKKKTQSLDLTQAQCEVLAEYVGSLPAPRERVGVTPQERHYLASGYELFHQVGCATCHTPRLGEVVGLYSDLLLHDMGSGLADGSAYYNALPNSTEEQESVVPLARVAQANAKKADPVPESKLIGALRQEWRTPPLWGVRDSAPYLHDGRADTLEQAIVLHGGEAQRTTERYAKLSAAQRLQLTTFLKSLEAPR